MTTPPPPWEAHPPLPEDEFGDVDRAPHDDADEDTGPIHIAPSVESVDEATTVISTDFADTVLAETGSADTAAAPVVPDESIHSHATSIAGYPVEPPPARREYFPGPVGYPPTPPPPRPEDTYAGRFTAPLSVDPRSIPLKQNNFQPVVIVAAAVAGVLLIALAVWWLWPSGGDDATAEQTSATPTIDAEAHDKLMSLLPAGYAAEACTPEQAPEGASAVVNCRRNTDAGGPATATYTLLQDAAALDAAIEKTIDEARVVNCPGRIQSPGPWRRNANPQKIAGTLVCGMSQQQGMVAWTTESALLLNVTRADPEGPTLDQLFTWWQSHS